MLKMGLFGKKKSKEQQDLEAKEWLAEERKKAEQYKKAYIAAKKKTAKAFINTGSNDFIDISSEVRRVYEFTGGDAVVIEDPVLLCVKDNGHRVWDAQHISHYIPMGWIHLKWTVVEGQPNFVK